MIKVTNPILHKGIDTFYFTIIFLSKKTIVDEGLFIQQVPYHDLDEDSKGDEVVNICMI